jgi:protoporphyrinogen oxidase
LESVTAKEWLLRLCGPEVYRVVWEPLLRGKFGPFAPEISAVWFWNKLVLRGGSRSKTGKEVLAYYRGGLGTLVEKIADAIKSAGGVISTGVAVESLIVQDGHIKGVQTPDGVIYAEAVIATPELPIIADLVKPYVSGRYVAGLRRIKYLANVCLVLELFHSLSDIYWLNVSDNDFPFIGVIEHTNFRVAQDYSGRHIVYMSKYFPETSEMYRMNEEQVFEFSLPYIKRMFAKFDRSWVRNYHVWKARYAQPVVVCDYSSLVPSNETPIEGLYTATMDQIYPEDRGINYAIREGRRIGQMVMKQMGGAEVLI